MYMTIQRGDPLDARNDWTKGNVWTIRVLWQVLKGIFYELIDVIKDKDTKKGIDYQRSIL